jgi:hypothetical protein
MSEGARVRSTPAPCSRPRPTRAIAHAACAAASLLALLCPAGASAAEPCPNETLGETQGSTFLPDCRAYEMVSPVEKNGGDISASLTRTRAAVDGNAVQFTSMTGFGDVRGTGAIATDYIAERSANGWATHGITPPQTPPAFPAWRARYVGDFSEDLSTGVSFALSPVNGEDPNVAQLRNLYLRRDLLTPGPGDYQLLTGCTGCTSPLPRGATGQLLEDPALAGASTGFGHVIFESRDRLTPDAPNNQPEACSFEHEQCHPWLYESVEGHVRLVGLVPPEGHSECSGSECAPAPESAAGDGALDAGNGLGTFQYTASAISRDGSRITFTAGPFTLPSTVGDPVEGRLGDIYTRIDGERTIKLNVSERTDCADHNPCEGVPEPDPAGPQPAMFGGASQDGSKVFFMTSELLTDDTPPGGGMNLYMYDLSAPAGHRLTVLTHDTEPSDPGSNARARYVVGTSADGSYVYFWGENGLTPGHVSEASIKLLYVWHDGTLRFLGSGETTQNEGQNWGEFGIIKQDFDYGYQVRVSPGGRDIVFATSRGQVAESVGFNNRSPSCAVHEGSRCSEIYLYDYAANRLTCVSCDTGGLTPLGDANFATNSQDVTDRALTQHLNHALSDDGQRVFFDTRDPLVPQDTNGRRDVYEYDATTGRVSLISSGRSSSDSLFVEATPSGSDVYFTTRQQLVGIDSDEAADLYDARVGGGIAAQSPYTQIACGGEACRGAFGGTPGALSFASSLFAGAGNLAPSPSRKGKAAPSRSKRLAKALGACRHKHHRRAQRKRCEASARKRYGKASLVKASNATRRGGLSGAPAAPAGEAPGPGAVPEVSEKLSEWAHLGAEPGSAASTSAETGTQPRVSSSSPASCETSGEVEAAFGICAVDGQYTDNSGNAYTQAGGHPADVSVQLELNHHLDTDPLDFFATELGGGQVPDGGNAKDILTTTPPGLIGNPTTIPKCTTAQLAGGGPGNPFGLGTAPTCPIDSQVGVVTLETSMTNPLKVLWEGTFPLYNMTARPSVPASFGFQVTGSPIILDATLRSDGDYGITVASHNILEAVRLWGLKATFWGVPADPSHDLQRCDFGGLGLIEDTCGGPTPAGLPPTAFLRMPTRCTQPGEGLETSVSADTWENPGVVVSDSFTSHLPPNFPEAPGPVQGTTGCERVPFDPTFSASPPSPVHAGAPSGFRFELKMPQSNDPAGIGEADLKSAHVTLPAGVRVSPSSANGLEACTPAQIGLIGTNFPDPNPIHFNQAEPSCPYASKLGTVTVTTPLLEKPLSGTVYLAAPHENPFGSLVALYLVVKGPGVIVKLPGRVDLDPSTGQITTTFQDTPQLPFSDLQVDLDAGPRAALTLPTACGTYTTHALLTSWSGASVSSDSSFTIDEGANGGACTPSSFNPSFIAGTTNPLAGGFSPFALQLQRGDGEAGLGSLSTLALPPGLLADVASVPIRCSEAEASAAACPASSLIGHVSTGAGAGPDPFYVSGNLYLMGQFSAGPFKGDPFGVAAVVHATAGPFDLGYVVVRDGVQIHDDGSVAIQGEPFPTILQGIPLQLRDVRVSLDRPGFTLNPTNCNPLAITGVAGSTQGQTAPVSSRFQAGECRALAFNPHFTASTQGSTSKANGASLDVKLSAGEGPHTGAGGEANIAKVDVQLPTALPSRLTTLQKACTEAQFKTNPAGCPAASNVGAAVARSPILASPLEGPAILVSHGGRAFPDLVLILQGEGIVIHLTGHTQIKNGITYSRFETVPDAPISSFELKLPEGPHSALAANGDLCKTTTTKTVRRKVSVRARGHTVKRTRLVKAKVPAALVMPTMITGQNGAALKQNTPIAVNGCR